MNIVPIHRREPVAIAALVRAVILAAVAGGFDLTGEQIAAVMLVVELALGVQTRRQVTPNGMVDLSSDV